jgi:hypothetical protein
VATTTIAIGAPSPANPATDAWSIFVPGAIAASTTYIVECGTTSGSNFQTISEAIRVMPKNGIKKTILVSGHCDEDIQIGTDSGVAGAGVPAASLAAGENFDRISIIGNPVAWISNSSSVGLTNITISKSKNIFIANLNVSGSITCSDYSSCYLLNVDVSSPPDGGAVSYFYGAVGTISGSVLHDSGTGLYLGRDAVVHLDGATDIRNNAAGVQMKDNTQLRLEDAKIHSNQFGVRSVNNATGPSNVEVWGEIFENSTGIKVGPGSHVLISPGGLVANNSGYGIIVGAGSTVAFTSSSVYGNTSGDVFCGANSAIASLRGTALTLVTSNCPAEILVPPN